MAPTVILACSFITPQAAVGNGGDRRPPAGPSRACHGVGAPNPPVHTCFCCLRLHPSPPSFPVFQAQAVTLTVAQAFKVAFEFWQVSKEGESSLLSFVSDVNRDR